MTNSKPCPSCGGDCGYTKKKGCQYKTRESKWVGLTENQIDELEKEFIGFSVPNIYNFVQAIETKLKEKNK